VGRSGPGKTTTTVGENLLKTKMLGKHPRMKFITNYFITILYRVRAEAAAAVDIKY